MGAFLRKIFGICYAVDGRYFDSSDNAAKYSDQQGDKVIETLFLQYGKRKNLFDEAFEKQEYRRVEKSGFVNHRDW